MVYSLAKDAFPIFTGLKCFLHAVIKKVKIQVTKLPVHPSLGKDPCSLGFWKINKKGALLSDPVEFLLTMTISGSLVEKCQCLVPC